MPILQGCLDEGQFQRGTPPETQIRVDLLQQFQRMPAKVAGMPSFSSESSAVVEHLLRAAIVEGY
jgi:hypothetical protein